jgi:tRNA U34 5-carboxymethylaminomethyl modifying GTPase MnmE/TrmE
VEKYGIRMSPSNLKKLQDLILILAEFKKYFEKKEDEFLNDKKNVKILNIIEVLEDTDLYTFDF